MPLLHGQRKSAWWSVASARGHLTLIYDASNPLFLQEQKSTTKILLSDLE